ncbi:MAG: hypothetical protein R3208_14705 [Ketobacteraceae bacterium]|nr:hypothetical protein [Ketobacteraceae bacterium]
MSAVSRKHILLPVLVGLLLVSPSLFTGLQLDDYYHWGLVTENPLAKPGNDHAGLFKLFTFLDGDPARTQWLVDKGMLPWWTLPEVKYMFWRPVSELTHGIDYLLWPQQPIIMHAHSLLYFVILLLVTYQLLQRWLSGRPLVWAYWIFCLSYTHGFAAGWLANRNAVIASLFVALTLYYHDRWRREQQGRFHLAALVCFVLSLLSGEIGVSAGLFLLSYALCFETSNARQSLTLRKLRHLLSIVPYGVAGMLWLLARGLMGYGAEGSGHYVDPADPGHFLATVSERYLLLANGLFWSIPPEFAGLMGDTLPVVIALAGMLLLGLVFKPLLSTSPLARFLLLSILIMLIPVCATQPHSRLLIAASIPLAALAGLYLGLRWEHRQRETGLRRMLSPLASGLLIISLLVLSPLLLVLESVQMKIAMDGLLNRGAMNLQINPDQQSKVHVLINPPVSSVAGYIQGVRAYHGLATAKAVIPLVSASGELELHIKPGGALEITSQKGLYEATQESLLRSSAHALQPGDRLTVAGIDASVLAVDDSGIPVKVQFQFPPERDKYVFHLWHGGKPVQCELPPPGTRLTLTRNTESC